MDDKGNSQAFHRLAIGVTIVLWLIAAQASAVGFAHAIPMLWWVGYPLVLSATLIKFIFNEERLNNSITMVVIGLLAYAYCVVTISLAWWGAMGSPDVGVNPGTVLFPALLGFFFAIAPEVLFWWGWTGADLYFGRPTGRDRRTHY